MLPRGEMMCQYDSDLFNTRPPSLSLISFSFFILSHLQLFFKSPLFSHFSSLIWLLSLAFIYHCLLSLPLWISPHISSLALVSLPFLSISPGLHAHVLVTRSTLLTAPLLIHSRMDRTGQSLKQLASEMFFLLIAQLIESLLAAFQQ